MNYKWILLGLGILLILLIIYKKRGSILGLFKPCCPYAQSSEYTKEKEDFQSSIQPPDQTQGLISANKTEYIVLSISKSPEENKEVPIGDIYIKLYEDICPKTCHNFKSLSKIEYKGCVIHRLIKGFMLQTGDYEKSNGTGGASVYGKKFPDENFTLKHSKRGILSMANSGPDTNGSQFFITFDAAPHLDGKHVVFGEVVKGWNVLDAIEAMQTNSNDEPTDLLYISTTKITNHI
jgi:peptidyl-prolyl cis-trans isomerase B (cyclophilin B)